MKLSIKIEGISDIQHELKNKINREKISNTLRRAAILVQAEAMRYCPVQTGYLQKSITHRKITDLTYEVAATANYADYIEFGTYKLMCGTPENPYVYSSVKTGKYPSYRPFLRSAAYDCQYRIIDMFEGMLNDEQTS